MSYKITLQVLDENDKPTTAAFEFRDKIGRVYPSQSKRLAPDFAFHPQVYRKHGEKIRLPAGMYNAKFYRGPESVPQNWLLEVTPETKSFRFKVERWIDPAFEQVYRHVFSGHWRAFDPFDGAYRTEVQEIPSPAVCSMFRTYQGWTALTPQGPGDGTLRLIPTVWSIVYLLLRALQDDVPEESLCGAQPGRALSATEQWHAPLLPALTSIPLVEPGDTVWWHPDVIHAVEDVNRGEGYSNVIYIGAAPYCAKNAAYLEGQSQAFLRGASAPDFATEDYETTYQGRATLDDLTDLGQRQMGLLPW